MKVRPDVEEAKARLRALGEEVDAERRRSPRNLVAPALAAGAVALAGGMLLRGRGRKAGSAKVLISAAILGRLAQAAAPVVARAILSHNGRAPRRSYPVRT